MLQRFLLVWLILLCLLAWFWPAIMATVRLDAARFDPFFATHRLELLKPLFCVAMFAIGCLLPGDEIAQVIRRWPTVLGGTVVQYSAMPLLAWIAVYFFRLEGNLAVGVIVVGCVPGAMASNVVTLAARGNVSYSVSLTTSSTLLSPFIVPLTLKWSFATATDTPALDAETVFYDLIKTVVAPVLSGYLMCLALPRFAKLMQRLGPPLANGTILWIIAVVVGLNRDRLWDATPLMLSALLFVNIFGYAAGYFGGKVMRLTEPMRRALTIEVGMQNAGLGTVLVLSLFPDNPAAAIPTAAYTFGCMLTGTMLAQWWARREPGRVGPAS